MYTDTIAVYEVLSTLFEEPHEVLFTVTKPARKYGPIGFAGATPEAELVDFRQGHRRIAVRPIDCRTERQRRNRTHLKMKRLINHDHRG